MKEKFYFLLSITFLTATSLHGYFEIDGTFSAETINTTEKGGPFAVTVEGDIVTPANFTKSRVKHEHLSYANLDAQARIIFYYDPENVEGLHFTLGYSRAHIKWKDNPFFNQSEFNTAIFGLGGFTRRLCNWIWVAQVQLNIDADHFDIEEYADYDFILWGRYSYQENIGINIGILAETGMKIDWVYPILGVDWQINDKWQLNLVYPVNISVIYTMNCYWSCGLAGRAFATRYRLNAHANLSKGLITYQATGVEAFLNYDYGNSISANIHAGSTFGGVFKVANRHYSNKHRFDFEPSAYFGGEIEVKF